MYKKSFIQQYDTIIGTDDVLRRRIKHILLDRLQKQSHVLELGCGTGNMLQALEHTFTLYGLDTAIDMLTIARKKVPLATYYHADMSNFSIGRKFDAIFCISDSINHLATLSQWKTLFSCVRKHLSPTGIFIFDMNTVRRMETLSTMQPYIRKINKDTLLWGKVHKGKKGIYEIRFQVFNNINKKHITYIEQIVYEVAFELEKVEKVLKSYFVLQQKIDPIRQRIVKKTGRIIFVCTLRPS